MKSFIDHYNYKPISLINVTLSLILINKEDFLKIFLSMKIISFSFDPHYDEYNTKLI